ncbi:MAG: NAD(P)/FAD-dependent oxidoreductase, partial [Pseudomonadota bacterium]
RGLPALSGRPDVVVVGAGFTGLSAALTLAEAGARVQVLEAGTPGQGASARNAGMIGSPHKFGGEETVARYGPDLAARLFAEGREAYAWTAALAGRVEAGFRRWGRLRLAWTRAHFEALRAEARVLTERGGYELEVLGPGDLRAEIGSDRYFGGVLHPDHGGLDPRRFHDGLLRAALEAGAEVVAGVPVTGLRRGRAGLRLTTPEGEVEADEVIFATNGYTPRFLRGVWSRVFAVPSYIIVTEPLPEGAAERLAPGRRMMVETRRRSGYFRLTSDGTRLLYGGRAAVHPIPLERAARRLRALMAETFPELADQPLAHCWTGTLGFTFAHHPHLGRTAEGALFALGYSGNGVALSPWLGRKAALSALGRPEGATAFSETAFETRAWRPLMALSMAPASLMQRPVDWLENRAAARDRRAGG